MKADLPLLDSTSSANVLVVLAIGISLAVLGGLLLAVAVVIIVRQRRQLRSMRKARQDLQIDSASPTMTQSAFAAPKNLHKPEGNPG